MTMSDRFVGAAVLRAAAVVAASALALALLPAAVASADEHLFCLDVPQADIADRAQARATHRANVDCVIHTGISVGTTIDGTRYYLPLNAVTRGQMATFIANTLDALEIALPDADDPDGVAFNDIAGHTHAENILRIANAGIVRGTGAGAFSPNDAISRQQMATFIVQAGAYAYDATVGEDDWIPDGDYFGDVATGNVHAANINLGYELELFSGTTPPGETPRSGAFSPAVTVLRDQMATFLTNLAQFVRDGEVEEPDPVPTGIDVTGGAEAFLGGSVLIEAAVVSDGQPFTGQGTIDWTVSEGAQGVFRNATTPDLESATPLSDGSATVRYTSSRTEPGAQITVTGTLRGTSLSESHSFTVSGPNATDAQFVDAGTGSVFGDEASDVVRVLYAGQLEVAADATIEIDPDGPGAGAAVTYTRGSNVTFTTQPHADVANFTWLIVTVTDTAATNITIQDEVSAVIGTTGVTSPGGTPPSTGYWEIITIVPE